MNKILKVLLGFVLAFGPLYLILPGMPLHSFGEAVMTLIKGGLTLGIIFVGLILLIIGFSEIKN